MNKLSICFSVHGVLEMDQGLKLYKDPNEVPMFLSYVKGSRGKRYVKGFLIYRSRFGF